MRSLLLGLLVLSGVAHAGHLVLPVNVQTDLPSCGGTVESNRNGNQINLVFRKVKDCSNFDIVSKGFGILDLGYKNKKIPQDSSGRRTGSFTIPQVYIDRGLNLITVEVRSNSGAHSDSITLVFATNPLPVFPKPTPIFPGPKSLLGFCSDYDYSNFKAAKAFAYASAGLGMYDSEATKWATDYNRNHRCNTIGEYRARFTELYNYAYQSAYLGKYTAEARTFALGLVETTTVDVVANWKDVFSAIQPFFYNSNYLGKYTAEAREASDAWTRRGYCGGRSLIENLKSEFTRHFNFAYSSTGLNKSTAEARVYAAGKVRYLTACSDLIK